jgi:hypothetical protein
MSLEPELEDEDGDGPILTEAGTPYSEEEVFADPGDESAYIKVVTALGIVGRKEILLPLIHRRSYVELAKGTPLTDPYWTTPEGVQELAYWRSPESQSTLAALEEPNAMLQELTNLVTYYSDDATAKCLKTTYGQIRDFFEVSTPQTQCANTIRGPKPDKTLCWICKGKITGFNLRVTIGRKTVGLDLKEECEHVFPIAQALVFSGLYEAQLFKQIEEQQGLAAAEAYRVGVTYEYQWAHRICNQVKNDSHYLTHDATTGQFRIDDTKIDAFLTKLETTPNYGTGAALMEWLRQEARQTPEQWAANGQEQWRAAAKANLKAVSERLLSYANTSGLTPKQHARVTYMCMRSYIATSPCGGAKEDVPKNVVKVGTTGGLSVVPWSVVVDTAKYYTSRAVVESTGVIQHTLSTSGRTYGSAKDRALVSSLIPDIGVQIRDFIGTQFLQDAGLRTIVMKLLFFLKRLFLAGTISQVDYWSKFQIGVSQVIPGAMFDAVTTAIPRLVLPPDAKDLTTGAPTSDAVRMILQSILRSPALGMALDQWKTKYFDMFTTAGVPIREILATDPLVDPDPRVPNPQWTPQAGGGWHIQLPSGGLRKRRGLYGNARSRTSSSAGGEHDAGLRKRTWPRTTSRVRQRSRRSQTRRQRKSLDRL